MRRRHGEQLTGAGDVFRTIAVGEQAVMADAMEAFRQHMHQKSADELAGCQGHRLVTLGPFDHAPAGFQLTWGGSRRNSIYGRTEASMKRALDDCPDRQTALSQLRSRRLQSLFGKLLRAAILSFLAT